MSSDDENILSLVNNDSFGINDAKKQAKTVRWCDEDPSAEPNFIMPGSVVVEKKKPKIKPSNGLIRKRQS